MSAAADWTIANAAFLGHALAWLRDQLAAQTAASSTPQRTAEPNWSTAARPLPALLALKARFDLSDFETKIVLLCAAVELDPTVRARCLEAMGADAMPGPSFALCLALFPDASWEALSPHQPLRAWNLVEVVAGAHRGLVNAPLRTDERIIHYLKGLNEIDERVAALLLPPPRAQDATALAPSQQAIADALADAWRARDGATVVLVGTATEGKLAIAETAARACDLILCRIPVDALPTLAADLDAFERLWRREHMLLPLALMIEVPNSGPEGATGDASLRRSRAIFDGAVVVSAQEVPRLDRSVVVLLAPPLTRDEQDAFWCHALGDAETATALATQFTLPAAAIAAIGRRFASTDERKSDRHAAVWAACRETLRPRLDGLARRIDIRATWDDLVLPPDSLALLRNIVDQMRHRRRVHEDWGFAARSSRGMGISALFAGESGTGKTLAAEVLAGALNLDLYLVDLSGVVSKYIGDTEKNLRRLFDAAEDSGAILFFDEADALFGKRSDVRDSHDRYANIEINYLLQRIEAYRGLAILATNLRGALDSAFLRRLRFVVAFPYPSLAQRQAIWQRAFPSASPLGLLDWSQLGRLNLTGGNIATAAINAAFLASADGSRVEMRHVLTAARAEMVKLDRPFRDADFVAAPPVEHVA